MRGSFLQQTLHPETIVALNPPAKAKAQQQQSCLHAAACCSPHSTWDTHSSPCPGQAGSADRRPASTGPAPLIMTLLWLAVTGQCGGDTSRPLCSACVAPSCTLPSDTRCSDSNRVVLARAEGATPATRATG